MKAKELIDLELLECCSQAIDARLQFEEDKASLDRSGRDDLEHHKQALDEVMAPVEEEALEESTNELPLGIGAKVDRDYQPHQERLTRGVSRTSP